MLASINTGAPWHLILWYQLAKYQLSLQRRYPSDPRRVWAELLDEHHRRTGHRNVAVPSDRLDALAAATDPQMLLIRENIGAN